MPQYPGEYWGIMMTTERNPVVLAGETGTDDFGTKRSYRTYYEGRNLQRVAFTENGVTYWVSNTLKSCLSAKTMEEIVKSMRPLAKSATVQGRHRHRRTRADGRPHPVSVAGAASASG